MIRKALLVISAVGLLGLAAACTTSEPPIVRTSGMSPPPPPSAPVELVSRIADAVSEPVKESRATTGEVEGDPFEVNLEDPGGSGEYGFDPGGLTFNVGDVRATTGEVEGDPFEVNLEDPGGSGEYGFDPGGLTFNVGDVIAFTLTAETEFHTFTVDDLDIDEAVDASGTIRFSFTFDQAGTYELICIPHGTQGMVATITVR